MRGCVQLEDNTFPSVHSLLGPSESTGQPWDSHEEHSSGPLSGKACFMNRLTAIIPLPGFRETCCQIFKLSLKRQTHREMTRWHLLGAVVGTTAGLKLRLFLRLIWCLNIHQSGPLSNSPSVFWLPIQAVQPGYHYNSSTIRIRNW